MKRTGRECDAYNGVKDGITIGWTSPFLVRGVYNQVDKSFSCPWPHLLTRWMISRFLIGDVYDQVDTFFFFSCP